MQKIKKLHVLIKLEKSHLGQFWTNFCPENPKPHISQNRCRIQKLYQGLFHSKFCSFFLWFLKIAACGYLWLNANCTQ